MLKITFYAQSLRPIPPPIEEDGYVSIGMHTVCAKLNSSQGIEPRSWGVGKVYWLTSDQYELKRVFTKLVLTRTPLLWEMTRHSPK